MTTLLTGNRIEKGEEKGDRYNFLKNSERKLYLSPFSVSPFSCIILIALGMYLLPVKAYCDLTIVQPAARSVAQPVVQSKVREITGEVSQIDSVGGVVVLQTIDALGVPQEVKFYIGNNDKGIGGNAHLMDVNVSDWVTIRFTVDSSGDHVIIKLTDDNITNNPI